MLKTLHYLVIVISCLAVFFNSNAQGLAGSGNALDFDDAGGTNGDYVVLPSSFPDLVSTNFTVAAWIKSDNVGANGQRVFCYDESNNSAGFSLSLGDPGTGRLRFYIRGASGGAGVSLDVTNSTYYLQSNVWYHVAITHTTPGNNTRTIYINGIDVRNDAYTSNPTGKAGRAAIGGETNSGETNNRFNGQIDEVSIWSKALSQTEIRDLMCKKLVGNETNLMAYYRFDQSSGTTATDETGNYNGVLTNMDPATDWVTSGAPIGNSSTYGYNKGAWGGNVITHTSSDGDSLQVSSVTGNPECVHIYNVSSTPSSVSGITGIGGNATYYGVFHGFGSSTTYTGTYFYGENNAFQISNPVDESFNKVFTRANNSSSSWVQGTSTINTTNKTLTLTALSTEFMLGNTQTPLPVTFIKFEGKAFENHNLLEWETATEINADRFQIERSLNGINWEAIGSVSAAGNSNQILKYNFQDADYLDVESFYRLKQIDFDGQFEYSNVVLIDRSSIDREPLQVEAKISLFPNPTKAAKEINIISNLSLEKFGFIEIYNVNGQFVQSSPIYRTKDNTQAQLKLLEGIEAGQYILRLMGDYETKTFRLIIE